MIDEREKQAMGFLVGICESYRTPEELMYLAREFEVAAFRAGWKRTEDGAFPAKLHPKAANAPTFNHLREVRM